MHEPSIQSTWHRVWYTVDTQRQLIFFLSSHSFYREGNWGLDRGWATEWISRGMTVPCPHLVCFPIAQLWAWVCFTTCQMGTRLGYGRWGNSEAGWDSCLSQSHTEGHPAGAAGKGSRRLHPSLLPPPHVLFRKLENGVPKSCRSPGWSKTSLGRWSLLCCRRWVNFSAPTPAVRSHWDARTPNSAHYTIPPMCLRA
jgi:hypothetical protein